MDNEWKIVRLGDVGKIVTGSTPKTSDSSNYNTEDICFFKPSDLKDNINILSESEYKVSFSALNSARELPENSILVSCIGIIGKIGILTKKSISNQQINAIIPNNNYNSKFIAYSILHNRQKLQNIANAPIVPIINKSSFSNFQIFAPSLKYQEEIAQILDKANEFIEKRKKQLRELDRLAESVFYDMFGDPVTNSKGWEKGKIGDICKSVSYGTSSPANQGGKYKYLRMNNITYSGGLDFSDLKYIDVTEKEYEKYVVRRGDILFNRTNSRELVGKTSYFNTDEEMIIAGYIIRIRITDNYSPIFVSKYLNTNYIKLYLKELCKSIIGQANINAKELQSIPIFFPPLHLQHQFASIIEKIEAQKAKVKEALKESEDLFQRLMQDMFNPEYHKK